MPQTRPDQTLPTSYCNNVKLGTAYLFISSMLPLTNLLSFISYPITMSTCMIWFRGVSGYILILESSRSFPSIESWNQIYILNSKMFFSTKGLDGAPLSAIIGNLSALQWFWNPGQRDESQVQSIAGVLIRDRRGCPWDERICFIAARGGYLSVLQWARSQRQWYLPRRCSWWPSICALVGKKSRLFLE